MKKSRFDTGIRTIVAVLGLSLLSACGGGSDGSGSAGDGSLLGTFSDSQVAGLAYESTPSGYTGTTNSNGQFKYLPLDTVEFTVNGMSIGTGTAGELMTPLDLVTDPMEIDTTKAEGQQNKVIKILRLLQMLDTDSTPSNGITLANDDSLAATTLDALDITTLGVQDVSQDDASTHFIQELDKLGKSGKSFYVTRIVKKLGGTINGVDAAAILEARWTTRRNAVETAIQEKLDTLTTDSTDSSKHGVFPGVVVHVTLPDGTNKAFVSGDYDMGADTSVIDGDEKDMDASKHFRLGSITKTFTAMTILQLISEGKVDLNQDAAEDGANLETYLLQPIDGVRDTALVETLDPNGTLTEEQLDVVKKVTVYQLLTHMSGIPQSSSQPMVDGTGNFNFESWTLRGYLDPNLSGEYSAITGNAEPFTAWTSLELLDVSWGVGITTPATWSYSNMNYVLLGMIIEAVTGNEWYTEVMNRFGPESDLSLDIAFDSGTDSTTLPGGDDKGSEGYVDWYNSFLGYCQAYVNCDLDTKTSVVIHPSFYGSAGGLTGDVDDIYKWAAALGNTYEGKTVAEGALVDPDVGFDSNFLTLAADVLDMGLGVFKNVTHKMIGHPGQVQGYDCAVWYRYDVQEPIAACTNTTIDDEGKVQDLALYDIMDILDGKVEVN